MYTNIYISKTTGKICDEEKQTISFFKQNPICWDNADLKQDKKISH